MDESTRISALAEFHAAEYAAMMNSVSIWKTLQYALWPILLGFWLLLGQFADKLLDYVVPWAMALVLPIGYLAYQAAAIDALHGVLLIERDVRPLDWAGFAICAGASLFVTFLTRDERRLHEQIDAMVGAKAPR
jgi:hypothetical protein